MVATGTRILLAAAITARAINGRARRRWSEGRGNFDPEAMRKVMDTPEVKAQMEQIQGQEQKLTTQLAAAVNKVLTPRQSGRCSRRWLGPARSILDRRWVLAGRGAAAALDRAAIRRRRKARRPQKPKHRRVTTVTTIPPIRRRRPRLPAKARRRRPRDPKTLRGDTAR